MKKVILISIDGMRADAAFNSSNSFKEKLVRDGLYSFSKRTVFPSVTLPCHMSMMHSVPPERHGILTNTFTPQVRPVNGLFEQLKSGGGKSAMFTNWVELRDIAMPSCLALQFCISDKILGGYTDRLIEEAAAECVKSGKNDFIFVHFVSTDHVGHAKGWMSREYLDALDDAFGFAEKVYEAGQGEYTLFLTADHGGHDRTHGTDKNEDMTVPFFAIGDIMRHGEITEQISILDIAPTIASFMGFCPGEDWEGKIIDLN